MRDPSLIGLLDALAAGVAADVVEAALLYFQGAHPAASGVDARSAACALAYYATDGDVLPGAPVNQALEQWLMRALDRVDPTDDALAVRLVDALVLLPRPGSSDVSVIREVHDLLSQTRHTFKSKQVERARKLLEPLIA